MAAGQTAGNIVIVGAGLAGATAARTFRSGGYTGPVILIGSERHNPYIRPPLSKDYLLGREGEDKAAVVPPGWYAANDVDLRLGVSATGIRPDAGTVLLIAVGVEPAVGLAHTAGLPADQRSGDLRRGRRGQCPAPVHRQALPQRALVQRP